MSERYIYGVSSQSHIGEQNNIFQDLFTIKPFQQNQIKQASYDQDLVPTIPHNQQTQRGYCFKKKQYFQQSQQAPTLNFRYEVTYITSEKKKQDYLSIKAGWKNETIQLNTNFKTIIYKHLKEIVNLREIDSPQDFKTIYQFKRRSSSFQSLHQLLFPQHPDSQIRKEIIKLLNSSKIIEKILCSQAQFHTKITMIKYIESLRLNTQEKGKIVKWKNSKV